MIFPDCRNDDYYNDDFLDRRDSEFLRGFDWAVEMAVDNFFDNEMYELQDPDGYLGHVLCEELPESMSEEYIMEFTFNDRDKEKRKARTYADLIRLKLLEWIEMERNELVTSLIDNMDEDLFNAIRNKKLKDNEKKLEDKKEYYDSRKYMFTGKKVGDGPNEDNETSEA